jgi:enterobacterial common antigen flippase
MVRASVRPSPLNRLGDLARSAQVRSVAFTTITTFLTFAIYLVQGVILARLLGPEGRGHFGTCLYFPRDLLLYAGLLGGIEILAAHSARLAERRPGLRRSAFWLGLTTGLCTAFVGAVLASILLVATGQNWLVPYAIVCSLFVPFEHIQLNMSAVDRGSGMYARYNINRLLFALSFPVLVALAWACDLSNVLGLDWLWTIAIVWLLSRIVGVIPTMVPPRNAVVGKSIKPESGSVIESRSVRELLREGRPYALSTLMVELFERLDILLVLLLCSMAEAGNYFVALPAAAILTIIPNALGVYAFNYGASASRKVPPGTAVRGLMLVAGIQLVTTLLYAAVVGQLVLFLFSDRFSASVSIVMWLLPAFAIRGFLLAAEAWLKGRGVTAVGVRARMISIAVMLLFVAATWPAIGLPSIPLASAVGQFCSLVMIVIGILAESRNDLATLQEGA